MENAVEVRTTLNLQHNKQHRRQSYDQSFSLDWLHLRVLSTVTKAGITMNLQRYEHRVLINSFHLNDHF